MKDRIIEFLAVGAMRGEMAGSILLLIGPPGVGKTSIGKSIAEALGRKFYRFSVGGMRDEAEIKGHRRTYIGAMPGKFVQALKEVDSANPVIMLDEIDKIGASYQGDPASALLEVLDPEQNADFLDHYLDVRFDLSKALFICTANDFSIPSALLDRMEVIRLSGYITEEKIAIAKHHLWPRVLDRSGLKKDQLTISEGALRHVIEGYAREAGVRNLEKQLGRVARKAVVKILGGAATPIRIGVKEVEAYLDKPVFTREKPMSGVGIVTGLAWTAMGGTTLPVEASRVHTLNRGFKLTGKLGEVMKESAEIAYSYVASHLKAYGADSTFFDKSFVHLHVPEGATPKDGPSAGVTMATALLSLAKNRKISRPLAMTGELTLDRPGAAGRRHPRKSHRRAPRRHHRTDSARRQPARLRQAARPHPRRADRAFRQALSGCGGGGVWIGPDIGPIRLQMNRQHVRLLRLRQKAGRADPAFDFGNELVLRMAEQFHGHLTGDQLDVGLDAGAAQFVDAGHALVFDGLLHQPGRHFFEAGHARHDDIRNVPVDVLQPLRAERHFHRHARVAERADFEMQILLQQFQPVEGEEHRHVPAQRARRWRPG